MKNNEITRKAKEMLLIEGEMERLKDLERVNFNKCYDEEHNRLRKELGFWRFYFSNKSNWNNLSKLALKLYRSKYGELEDKGDLEPKEKNGGKDEKM